MSTNALPPVPDAMADLIRPGDVALVIAPDTLAVDVPSPDAFARVVTLLAEGPESFNKQRSAPLDSVFWSRMEGRLLEALAEASSARGPGGAFHVFMRCAHAVALRLGQLLFQRYEGVPLTVYHYERDAGWSLFTPAAQRHTLPDPKPYLSFDEGQPLPGRGTILSIETPQMLLGERIKLLHRAAARVGARRIVRALPPLGSNDKPRMIGGLEERLGVLTELADCLSRIEGTTDAGPLHILTSSPVALMLLFARALRRTVLSSVIFHHYDGQSYAPLLDIVSGQPVPTGRYAVEGPPRAFISYARTDKKHLERLEDGLANLKRQGLIDTWHNRRIEPGTAVEEATRSSLEDASIFLALVSPDFIKSGYCYDVELTRALERQTSGTLRVIPILCRPCDWKNTPLGRLEPLPGADKTISKAKDQDSAWLEVTEGIRRVIKTLWLERSRP